MFHIRLNLAPKVLRNSLNSADVHAGWDRPRSMFTVSSFACSSRSDLIATHPKLQDGALLFVSGAIEMIGCNETIS